jgi:hypothetical protein
VSPYQGSDQQRAIREAPQNRPEEQKWRPNTYAGNQGQSAPRAYPVEFDDTWMPRQSEAPYQSDHKYPANPPSYSEQDQYYGPSRNQGNKQSQSNGLGSITDMAGGFLTDLVSRGRKN